MAASRKHATDDILDAARELVLSEGPRGASVSALAQISGAPTGTIYHRFGSRDGVLEAVWLRALERFQRVYLTAAEVEDAREAAIAMAGSVVVFAQQQPEDARLLLTVRHRDLFDARSSTEAEERLATLNAPMIAKLRRLARALHGRADARAVDAITQAVIDLPYAAVSRHMRAERPLPEWLEHDIAAGARVLLTGPLAR